MALNIDRLKKIDIHIHFEGCIDNILIQKFIEDRKYIAHFPKPINKDRSFKSFLSKIRYNYNFLYSSENYIQVLLYLANKLIKNNIIYIELSLNLGWIYSWTDNLHDLFLILGREINRIQEELGLTIKFIADCPWQFDGDIFNEILNDPLFFRENGVLGVDFAGDENYMKLSKFLDPVNELRKKGFGITIHAGEVLKKFELEEIINVFHPKRIRHGLLYANRIDLLKRNNICIDFSLLSNIHTGAITTLDNHPVKILYENKIPFSIGTDDPGIFNTNLNDELLLVSNILNLDEENLVQLEKNACNHILESEYNKKKICKRLS